MTYSSKNNGTTEKKTSIPMLVAFVSGTLLLASLLWTDSDSAPETEIRIAGSSSKVITDDLVKPVAAQIDFAAQPLKKKSSRVQRAIYETSVNPNQAEGIIHDSKVKLCQGIACDCNNGCSNCGTVGNVAYAGQMTGRALHIPTQNLPSKANCAVDSNSPGRIGPVWRGASKKPWEQFAYGEYIGPFRTPDVPDYRIRIGDQLEFVYLLTRRRTNEPYRINVGDIIQINSATDSALNQPTVTILSDGTISLPLIGIVRVSGKTIDGLQRELDDRYTKFVKSPEIVVQVVQGDTPLQDLRDAVDARAGNGGQSRLATVSPDGTIQLPLIGNVPAIGLTLEEIGREVNARYRLYLNGVVVTPILVERAARFIYVVGEVGQSGRFELVAPTTAIQAIALAQGFGDGGNLRQIIVFRRDANWQLIATKLDLNGALNGRRPFPADEIWLRDSDIVLVPKKPIQRLSEAVNQYLTTTLYSIFPQQGIQFNFDGFQTL